MGRFGRASQGAAAIGRDTPDHRGRADGARTKRSGAVLRPADILEGGEGAEGPSEVRYRAHVAFSTACDLLGQLEQIHNRRKSLIYISNGYDFNPFPGARSKAEQERMGTGASGATSGGSGQQYQNAQDDPTELFGRQGQQFAYADLARELAELTRTANRANVSFYTIDPRGLVGMPDLDETVNATERQGHVRTSQERPPVAADEPGNGIQVRCARALGGAVGLAGRRGRGCHVSPSVGSAGTARQGSAERRVRLGSFQSRSGRDAGVRVPGVTRCAWLR